MDVDWRRLKAPNIFANFDAGQQEARLERRQDTADAYLDERVQNERLDRTQEQEDRARVLAGREGAAAALGKGDMAGARNAAIGAGDPKLMEAIGKLDEQTKADLKERNEVQGAALHSLRDPNTGQLLPDAAQRWANMKQRFLSSGWKPEELDFDPLQPGVIDAEIAEAMELKDILARAETGRHNRAMEDIGRDRAESYDYSARRPRATGGGGRGGGGGSGGGAPSAGAVLNIDPSTVKWGK